MDELNKYSKTDPFKVPKDYFDDFDHKLMKKIEGEEYKHNGKWKIRSIAPYLAIAAGFLLLFSLWFMFLNKLSIENIASTNEVSDQDILFGYFESIDTDELIQIISEENYSENDFAINLEEDIDLIIDDLDESIIIEKIEELSKTDEI